MSRAPSRKVGASALAGALSAIIVFALNSYVLIGQQPITGEVAAAITTVLSALVGYMVPE